MVIVLLSHCGVCYVYVFLKKRRTSGMQLHGVSLQHTELFNPLLCHWLPGETINNGKGWIQRHKNMLLQQHCTSNTNSLFEKTQHNPLKTLSHSWMFDTKVHECCLQSYPSKYYISPHILKVKNRYMLLYFKTLYKHWIHIRVFCNKDIGTHSIYLLLIIIIHCTFYKIILPVPNSTVKALHFKPCHNL